MPFSKSITFGSAYGIQKENFVELHVVYQPSCTSAETDKVRAPGTATVPGIHHIALSWFGKISDKFLFECAK